MINGVHAAHDAQAHAAPVALAVEDLDDADLPGAGDMRRAAGAAVDPRDLHDAHLTAQLLLRAVVERGELRLAGDPCADGEIAAHGLVGAKLDLRELVRAQLPGEVDGHAVGAHVEAHVVEAEAAMHEAGDDMLARVVLHAPQALLEVEAALDVLPDGQGRVAEVDDLAAALLRVQHARAPQRSGIGALAAALREEGRAVERHGKSLLRLLAGKHLRGENGQMAVRVIELFGHGLLLFKKRAGETGSSACQKVLYGLFDCASAAERFAAGKML